jgi:hypothetical protein
VPKILIMDIPSVYIFKMTNTEAQRHGVLFFCIRELEAIQSFRLCA